MSPARRRCARWASAATVTLLLVAAPGVTGAGAAAGTRSGTPVTSLTRPVDLATPVDRAAALARPGAVLRYGKARIEVLSASLLRLEYSPTGHFVNRPTVNATDRRMPVPHFVAGVADGWLTVRTARATLRYRVGSGPFTPANTTLRLAVGGRVTTVHPTWEWECPFGQVCQAGSARITGGAVLAQTQTGYRSSAGYLGALFHPGAGATWDVIGAQAGPTTVTIRYSNAPLPPLSPTPAALRLLVNGRSVGTVSAPPTSAADPWAAVTTTVPLTAGTDSVEVLSGSAQNYTLGIDSLAFSAADSLPPSLPANDALGGWIRGYDSATYSQDPTCPPGTAGATCTAPLESLHTDGLLDTAGWRLIDDTRSAVWTDRGWVRPPGRGGDLEDGYLFVYGHDYAGALETLSRLTGSTPLLPRSIFGVWYSDYTPYSSADIEDSLEPAFTSHGVPLDTLSLDTDWKAPNSWNGWEWNPSLFPDPDTFFGWARSHHIAVTLDIHPSIQDDDPKLPATQAIAGGTLAASDPACSAGPCRVWDWSAPAQTESNFALQQSFERQGVSFWWLDWCCDTSTVTMPGLTPDAWIDHLYAQEMVDRGGRGFVLARIGSSNDAPEEIYPAGPWSNHTSAIAFTGDAWGTWNTLASEAALTPAEATIGEPYVSDDIGSFLGPPPRPSADPPDLYDRWVQLGTFQPLLRLHSDDESRLPWEYPQPVADITAAFLRLRQALIPYTYTLAAAAHASGLPMARPLYLDYPDQEAAYATPGEYLFGPDMLVAPVTTPGSVADTTVWFPPGRWTDYFTGATFTGPATATITEPLSRMPVFVHSGGIIPEQPTPGTTELKVYPGADGHFDLYGDSGAGLGYTRGQSTDTPITDTLTPGARDSARTVEVHIGPRRGHYAGAPVATRYRLDLIGVTRPTAITLDGRRLTARPAGSNAGWTYQSGTATIVIDVPAVPAGRSLTAEVSGTHPALRSEPAVLTGIHAATGS